MESVHILRRVHCLENPSSLDLRRQRQLHENAVDLVPPIELVNQSQQLRRRGRRRKFKLLGVEPEGLTGSNLAADIDLRCRIVANQYSRQSGFDPMPTQLDDA